MFHRLKILLTVVLGAALIYGWPFAIAGAAIYYGRHFGLRPPPVEADYVSPERDAKFDEMLRRIINGPECPPTIVFDEGGGDM